MTNCPIVLKRRSDLAISVKLIVKTTWHFEYVLANSRNTNTDGCGEYWKFQSNDAQVHLHAINCCKCGNYRKIYRDTHIPDKIRCECDKDHPTSKLMLAQIVNSERMDAFINIEREKNLLCEDVVGLILEYL